MKIIQDIDGCLLNTPLYWLEWLERVCDKEVILDEYDYNLTQYFSEELQELGMDGFEWWRGTTLYYDLKPYEDAVSTLMIMNHAGVPVNFVSKGKGNHNKSKSEWVKRYFPYYNSIQNTHEKSEVKGDIVIDDRLDNLYQFDDTVLKILYNTPFKQTLPLRDDVIVANSWEDIRNILLLELENVQVRSIQPAHCLQ